jgi:hypothetical protein
MTNRLLSSFLSFFFLMGTAGSASASVVWDNGAPDQVTGLLVTEDTISADDFTLSTDTWLSGGGFWTLEVDGSVWDGTLVYTIQEDSAGLPGSIVEIDFAENVTKTYLQDVNVSGFDYEEYFYTFDFASGGFELAAGDYWFSVFLQEYGTGDPSNFDEYIFWESTDSSWGESAQAYTGGTWLDDDFDTAFYLVSEPSPLALLLLTLPLFAVRRIGQRSC